MAKVTRTRLARGTKLLTEHVHVPLASIASEINAATVDIDQMQQKFGTFRINLNFPGIGSTGPFMDQNPFSVPFCLPPLQDEFNVNVVDSKNEWETTVSTPQVFLDEISVGFDQGDAPVARIGEILTGSGVINPDINKADYSNVQAYDLTVSLVEKAQEFFGNQDSLHRADRTMFSIPINHASFAGLEKRFNPIAITDINVSINPYKTYALVLHAPNIAKTTGMQDVNDYVFLSFTASMKFRSTMVTRDLNAAQIQNLPTKDTNQQIRSRTVIGDAIAITAPGANTAIEADSNDGVNINYEKIDRVFREGMKGGYNTLAEVVGRQELQKDASYEVIAVPLLGNQFCGGIMSRAAGIAPYCDAAAANADQVIADRRFIPIARPLTIHHAILAWNWQKFRVPVGGVSLLTTTEPSRDPALPNNSTFKVEVGVGLVSGLRSDLQAYQSIASHEMVGPYGYDGTPDATWSPTMFDRIKVGDNSADPRTTGAGAAVPNWDWEMHYMPIRTIATGPVVAQGTGYYDTGFPVFAGKAWSPTAFDGASPLRTLLNPGHASAAAPITAGQEQLIEVRIKLSDPTRGLADVLQQNLTGYGGHYLYLICKKALT